MFTILKTKTIQIEDFANRHVECVDNIVPFRETEPLQLRFLSFTGGGSLAYLGSVNYDIVFTCMEDNLVNTSLWLISLIFAEEGCIWMMAAMFCFFIQCELGLGVHGAYSCFWMKILWLSIILGTNVGCLSYNWVAQLGAFL